MCASKGIKYIKLNYSQFFRLSLEVSLFFDIISTFLNEMNDYFWFCIPKICVYNNKIIIAKLLNMLYFLSRESSIDLCISYFQHKTGSYHTEIVWVKSLTA